MSALATKGPVTRGDIEAKLRQIHGEVDTTVDRAKPIGIATGAVVIVAVIGLVYLMGRRRGRKRATFVEVRRFS